MLTRLLSLTVIFLAAVTTHSVSADQLLKQTADGWKLYRSDEWKNCYITKDFSKTDSIRVSRRVRDSAIVINALWLESRDGRKDTSPRQYEGMVVVDALTPWTGPIELSHRVYGDFVFRDFMFVAPAGFLSEFAIGNVMVIYGGGTRIAALKLQGTREATTLLRQC